MKLVMSDDLRTKAGLSKTLTEYVRAADTAAEQALTAVSSYIRSPLIAASYSDTYLLDTPDLLSQRLKLRLKAGFIDTNTLEIGTGSTQAEAVADNSLIDYATVNAEKGTLLFADQPLYRFLSVRYDAGFPALDDPDDTLDLTTAPQWLIDAAPLKALAILAEHPVFQNKEGKTLDSKSYEKQFITLAYPKIRYLPGHLTPEH